MRIHGYFNNNDEPALKLDLISKSIETLIDTGFAGSLVVPQNLSDDLMLQFEGFEEFYTVTGQLFILPRIRWKRIGSKNESGLPSRSARRSRKVYLVLRC